MNSRLLLFLFTTPTPTAATAPGIDITLRPVNGKQIPAVTSLQVAEIFGKRHANVLRDIRTILPKLTEGFVALNLEAYEVEYHTGFGMKKTPAYLLSKDGFIMLTMGYTGEKAMQFKEAYINRFNEMEAELARLANHVPDDPTTLGLPDCGQGVFCWLWKLSRKSANTPKQGDGK